MLRRAQPLSQDVGFYILEIVLRCILHPSNKQISETMELGSVSFCKPNKTIHLLFKKKTGNKNETDLL